MNIDPKFVELTIDVLRARINEELAKSNFDFFILFMKNTRKIQLWFLSKNGAVHSRK